MRVNSRLQTRSAPSGNDSRSEPLSGRAHNTVDVIIDGVTYPIDTGFIVYNPWTYPNFIALLEELGVATQPTEMGFSVHCERTGVEYNGTSLNGLFTQRRNLVSPRFHRLLRDILRFNRDAVKQVMGEDSPARDWTVAHFLDHYRYGNEFRDLYLLPMGSAIWSCTIGTFGQFRFASLLSSIAITVCSTSSIDRFGA